MHFCTPQTTPPNTLYSGTTQFRLRKTRSHGIVVKYRQHYVPANSRSLRSPRSLLFAQAVVNMELQVVFAQAPASATNVCLSLNVCVFFLVFCQKHTTFHFNLPVKSPQEYFHHWNPLMKLTKSCFYYPKPTLLVGRSLIIDTLAGSRVAGEVTGKA